MTVRNTNAIKFLSFFLFKYLDCGNFLNQDLEHSYKLLGFLNCNSEGKSTLCLNLKLETRTLIVKDFEDNGVLNHERMAESGA
jgi:hypothetical protein